MDEQAKKNQIDDEFLKKYCVKKEMPDHLAERKVESSILAFADYNAEHTENCRQKSSAKKEKEETQEFAIPSSVEVSHNEKSKPTIENIKAYFLEQNFPELEAIKFFNYFSSNGWLVGGKTPMVDWKAAAQNWMLNAPKFLSTEHQPNRAKHLNTGTDKDYSEPL